VPKIAVLDLRSSTPHRCAPIQHKHKERFSNSRGVEEAVQRWLFLEEKATLAQWFRDTPIVKPL
jgi:hypothetical protein